MKFNGRDGAGSSAEASRWVVLLVGCAVVLGDEQFSIGPMPETAGLGQ